MAQTGVSLACSTLRNVLKSRVRTLATSAKEVIKPPKHVLETMGKYQSAEATTPIHVVEGATDQVLFRSTMGACIMGLGGFATLAYTLGFSKKR